MVTITQFNHGVQSGEPRVKAPLEGESDKDTLARTLRSHDDFGWSTPAPFVRRKGYKTRFFRIEAD